MEAAHPSHGNLGLCPSLSPLGHLWVPGHWPSFFPFQGEKEAILTTPLLSQGKWGPEIRVMWGRASLKSNPSPGPGPPCLAPDGRPNITFPYSAGFTGAQLCTEL